MYITVEENIRIEFDRFYEALKFHGHNIENDVSDLLNILEENIIQEYNGQSDEIFNEGYDEGRDHGFESGSEEGIVEGRDLGYDDGFDDGQKDALEDCSCSEED
jgi:flagellar biosynthesis/type III secretory pathway protein FliH